ncbi:MAG: VWD domain-containing protein [Reyranellaceae bacterium]
MVNRIWTGAVDGKWETAANWNPIGAPAIGDDATLSTGFATLSTTITVNSIVINGATLDIKNPGGTETLTGGLTISGSGKLSLDAPYLGGLGANSLTIAGALTNTGTDINGLDIGNSGILSGDTVTASGLVNTGRINIAGNAGAQSTLNIKGVAGFGTAGVETGYVYLENNALLQFASGQISTINGTVWLNGANARIADASAGSTNSALVDLKTIAGDFNLTNGASVGPTSGGLSIIGTGRVALDAPYIGGAGGSTLTIGGVLTNSSTDINALDIGNGGITSAITVTATGLVNSGRINIVGNAAAQSTLNITNGAAGFGTTGVETGFVYLEQNALLQFASGQINTINGTVWLNGANARIADAGATSTNSALVGLKTVAGDFNLENGASVGPTSGGLNIIGTGRVALDAPYIGGAGGSTLTIGGVLTNTSTDINALDIGNGGITSAITVTATGLVNSGRINIVGNAAAQSTLNITSAVTFGTPGVETGFVYLEQNALLQFAGGQINTINGTVWLNGANARIATLNIPSTNSAMINLKTVAGDFNLQSGASVSPSGGLSITGTGRVALDAPYIGGAGGSTLTLGGTLANSSTNINALSIGNSSITSDVTMTATDLINSGQINIVGSTKAQATLRLTDGVGAFATATGFVHLQNNALLEFSAGQINTVTGTLWLDGKNARVADTGATSSNSALASLGAVSGTFALQDGAAATLPLGDLVITGTGRLALDAPYLGGNGGSTLTLNGRLTNTSTDVNAVDIGNASINFVDTVTALFVTNTGRINIVGSTAAQSTLNITKGVAGMGTTGVATGFVYLESNALLQFASGQLNTVAGTLWLNGQNARVADTAAPSTNSALIDLTTVSGSFNLENGASVGTTSGGLSVTGMGRVALDAAYIGGNGGSALKIGGTLTNASSDINALNIGNASITANTTVTAMRLDNSGQINIVGGATAQATLDIQTGTAGTGTDGALTGGVYLQNNALLQFGGGQIDTIKGTLWLNGKNARVADEFASTTNSALSELFLVSGSFNLQNGATVGQLSTGLTITGTGRIAVDANYIGGSGGSMLSIGGSLTNNSTDINGLNIGNGSIAVDVAVTANGLLNTGTIQLTGSGAHASLKVTTLVQNSGVIFVNGGGILQDGDSLINSGALKLSGGTIDSPTVTLERSGTLTGKGTIDGSIINNGTLEAADGVLVVSGSLSGNGVNKIDANATLEFGSGSPDAVFFNGSSATLRLDTPAAFTSTIIGFTTSDMIDLRGLAGGTSATLDSKNVLHVLNASKAEIAALHLTASNIGQSFTVGADGSGGTLITGGAIAPTGNVHNGVFQLFGPSNFDYTIMFPALSLAVSSTLSDIGGGRQKYVVAYSNGIQVEYDGTGLAIGAGGKFDPAGGTVDTIMVAASSGQGQSALLAQFSTDPAHGHTMLEAFTPTVLTGGPAFYERLLDGDNKIIGGPNDDFIVDNRGVNTIDGGGGYNTLYFGPSVTSVHVTSGDQPNDPLGTGSAIYVDDAWSDFWSAINKLNAATQLNDVSSYNDKNKGGGGSTNGNGATGGGTGEPHFTTFDGTYYDFMGKGEYVLTKSRVAGDTFEVQVRTSPYFNSTTLTAMNEVAVKVGSQRVTFDQSRPDLVWVDGAAATFSNNTIKLTAGHVDLVSGARYAVVEDSGETVNIIAWSGRYFDVHVSLGTDFPASSVEGLLGNADGLGGNDFMLKDGTVLSAPLTTAQLYGAFSDAWRVAQASSLLDYGAGQTTATFTDKNFPQNAIRLTDLPQDVVTRATLLAVQAGITDPGLIQQAAFDYAATGDANLITLAANAQQQGLQTTGVAVATGGSAALLGIATVSSMVVESSTAATGVTFEIYRTGDTSTDVTVSYAVAAPSGGYFNATDFGGTLPSGQVILHAGESSAIITINIPNTAITAASEALRVEISASGNIFASAAQVAVANNQPVAGTHASPGFEKLLGLGTLTHVGNAWTLDLGNVQQGQPVADLVLALANQVAAPGNSLAGSFALGGSGFTVTGANAFAGLAAGGEKAFQASVDTSSVGAHTETITLHSSESNDSGFSAALSDVTLTIKNVVVSQSTAFVSIAAASAVKAEGNSGSTAFTFTVSQTGDTSVAHTVNYAVTGSGANAANAADFGGAMPSGTVTFAPGETSKTITIGVSGDTTVEPDEGFAVTLANPSSGLTIGAGSATGTIQNDDTTVVPVSSHGDAYVVAQDHGLTIGSNNGVLVNDDNATTATLGTGPTHGSLSLASDGSFSYTPVAGFAGIDSFTYHAGNGSSTGDAQALLYVVPTQGSTNPTLNLLALNAEEQIAASYTAFFGRGADGGGFQFWVGQFNAGLPTQGASALFANIASSFGVSGEAKALYPFLANPQGASDSQISGFLDTVYNNLFNRSSDAAGLAYWTGQVKQTMAAGKFVGSVLVDIISGTQVGPDVQTLMGKVAVGLEFVHQQEAHGTQWNGATDNPAATALLHAVTSDPQSVLVGIKQADLLVAAHA